MSLVDQFYNIRPKRCEHLDALSKCIDWAAIQKLLGEIYASVEGAASYPILCYVRIVLLQQWYGLSDREAELSISAASLAFRWGEKVPDHTRIWAFRQKLAELGLDKKLFEEFNRQIEVQGCSSKRVRSSTPRLSKPRPRRPKAMTALLAIWTSRPAGPKKNGVGT